jgi:hypothetical protein
LSETHPLIRSACAACLDDLVDDFKKDLEEAKTKYTHQARWNAQSLAST